jgi:hypothetical protein
MNPRKYGDKLMWTIETVKRDLPKVHIRKHGKIYDGKLTGRLNQFASVSICGQVVNGRYVPMMGEIREYAWDTVTRILNANGVFNFDD